ncbi:hypothetical protein DYB35_008190 [Aphanomyces astaci]|uniref:Uncharacterized protein n=1 Tax=Aphanomyces astaci TaxID=112090 RepID=A0A3R6WLY1_APHAT|nr:hypothetical protein DYB35_008190 [Aphanomyces astaci]
MHSRCGTVCDFEGEQTYERGTNLPANLFVQARGRIARPDRVAKKFLVNSAFDEETWDVILLGPLSYSTKWTVRNKPHTGRITLVLDTGAYLGRCHGCAGGATLPDQAFAVPPSGVNYLVDPNVQWTREEAGPDNRIALKGDMGTYLSRCQSCVPIIGGVPDAMFMHARDWWSNGPAQFTLHRLPSTPQTMLAVKSSHDNSVESVDEATVAGTVMIVAVCVGVVVAAMTMHRRSRVRRQGFVRV